MDEEWWEGPVCYVCNYWWAGLLVIVLALAGYFTRNQWRPVLFPAPAVSVPAETTGLSDVTVSQREIVFSVRDNGNAVDGDVISVEVNGETVLAEFSLEGAARQVPVFLVEGVNEVVVRAHNEGLSSPNTVELSASHVVEGDAVQLSRGLQTGETESFVISAP